MSRVATGWRRFFFEPQSTASLALVRIGFGLVVLVWTLSLTGDLMDFFSRDGVLPNQPEQTVFTRFEGGVWGLLEVSDSDLAVLAMYAALLLGSIALIAGFGTRLAAVVVFVGVLSFERRNPFVFNSGDYLVRNLAFLVMLAPAGVALSVDRWRHSRERFWEFPARAPWALRLIQLQMSVLYITSVWGKVRGVNWNEGTAVGYALQLEDLQRLPVPDVLSDTLILTNVMTFGTLAAELALGVLIWNRAARPYVIAVGVAMHLFIDYSLLVGFFSYALFVCLLAFVGSERAEAAIIGVRDRVRRVPALRRRGVRREAPEPVASMRADG